MRKIILLISLICVCFKGHTQINLVHNAGFEDHWRCPQFIDLVKYANYWTAIEDTTVSPTDTLGFPPYLTDCKPEYCNTCSSYSFVTVPSSYYYTHFPRTGNGMMQVEMYYNEQDSTFNEKRDYLQGRLKNSLVSGEQYCVTFYVSLEGCSAYAIDHIGAYFDDAALDTSTNCGLVQSMYTPQIFESSIISDTSNWTKIQGIFMASGNERFITIGNFFDANHTDTIREHFAHAMSIGNDFYSLYLVDDVSVISIHAMADAGHDTTILAGDTAWIGNHDDYLPCKWYLAATGALIDSNHAGLAVHPSMTTSYVMELDVCGTLSYDTVTVTIHPTGINTQSIDNVKVYPNPVKDELAVDGLQQNTKYRLLNTLGMNIRQGFLNQGSNHISLSQLSPGIYILELTSQYSQKQNVRVIKE